VWAAPAVGGAGAAVADAAVADAAVADAAATVCAGRGDVAAAAASDEERAQRAEKDAALQRWPYAPVRTPER
jgi:hypothetical protein